MNNKINKGFYLVVTILLFWSGCNDSPQKPDPLVAEDTYTTLLVELQLVRSYQETGQADSVGADSLRQQIFDKYKVSASTFWDSHNYYQRFPKEQKKRIEKAIEELRMDRVADTTRASERSRN